MFTKFVKKFPIDSMRIEMRNLKKNLIKLGIPKDNFIMDTDQAYILCEDTSFKVIKTKATDCSTAIYNLHYKDQSTPLVTTIQNNDPVNGFINMQIDKSLKVLLEQLFPPEEEIDPSTFDITFCEPEEDIKPKEDTYCGFTPGFLKGMRL